jgi:hypothetical protein
MIGPDGLLLVVPTFMQFQLQFYWWGCKKKKTTTKLRHLILLSKVTYWAPVEMLLVVAKPWFDAKDHRQKEMNYDNQS